MAYKMTIIGSQAEFQASPMVMGNLVIAFISDRGSLAISLSATGNGAYLVTCPIKIEQV